MCQSGCAIVATIENGKLAEVVPDKDSPYGRICPRGALSPKLVHSSLRLTTPLIRVGERGKGEFQSATWDEALDKIHQQWSGMISRHGGKALASYFGRGVLGEPMSRFLKGSGSFLSHLGSPNDLHCGNICNYSSDVVAPLLTMGFTNRDMAPDIERSECIFVWGKNPVTDDGPQMLIKRLRKAKERGAEIIVIDPRGKGIAEEADWWLPIYPGTDGALALAMLKVILESGRYDRTFAGSQTLGLESFRQYLAEQSVSGLCRICHVSEEALQRLVDRFCATEKISFIAYTGWEYQLSGTQNFRMLLMLWALTGKLDVPGGQLITGESLPAHPYALNKDVMPVGSDIYPLFYKITGSGQFNRLPDAVMYGNPYPIRGLIVIGGSPALTFPGGKLWQDTYSMLDSLVVLDRYLTEECLYADVVLPATTLYENECVVKSPAGLRFRKQLIDPVGEARNDAFILAAIADRFGFGDIYPHNNEELVLWQLDGVSEKAAILREHSFLPAIKKEPRYRKYDSGLLRKDGKPGFPTPSGKFEIVSTIAEEHGYSGYPEYLDISTCSEACGEELPLMMTSGARSMIRTGSFGPNMPEIAEVEPIPYIEMSDATAAAHGISDGDRVQLTTAFGSCPFVAKIIPMVDNAVHVPHGGGGSFMTEAWRNSNTNTLCSLKVADMLTGFPIIKSLPCRIRPLTLEEL